MQLRWGICGSGNVCHDFVRAVKLLPETEHTTYAIAASKFERAEKFAKENEIPLAFGSYEELMKCPEIDIVYVGVVNGFHKNLVLTALNNGKHVLCEKPLGVNAAEVKEMVNLARQKKLFLMEGFWTRFFPACKLVQSEISNGVIGKPKLMVANFGYPFHAEVLMKETGSGTLLGAGCYCVMLSMMVFKEKPEKILAVGHLNKYGTDDTANVTFLYSGNRMLQFMQSATFTLENRAIIYGTQGQITLPNHIWCPLEVVTPSGQKTFPLPEHSSDVKFNYPHSEGLSYEAEIVRQCIVNGKTECDEMTLDESIAIAEINDEIRRQLGVRYTQDN